MKNGDIMLCTFEGDGSDAAAWYPADIVSVDAALQIATIQLMYSDLQLNVVMVPVSGAWDANNVQDGSVYSLPIHDVYAIENASPGVGDVALLTLADGTRALCRVDAITETYDLQLYHAPYEMISISADQITASGAGWLPVGAAISTLQRCAFDESQPQAVASDAVFLEIAEASAIRKYKWLDRGKAPTGYIDGMALAFVRARRLVLAADPVGLAMTAEVSDDDGTDALAWFAAELDAIAVDRSDALGRLIALFTLMLGLGMRESSGKHCVGRDKSAENTDATTAEAGLFQPAYNTMSANPLLPGLMDSYAGRTDLLETFSVGVTCSSADWQDWGTGRGHTFQHLTKNCPLYAVLHAAIVLRHRRKHWGPINRKTAEVLRESAALFESLASAGD